MKEETEEAEEGVGNGCGGGADGSWLGFGAEVAESEREETEEAEEGVGNGCDGGRRWRRRGRELARVRSRGSGEREGGDRSDPVRSDQVREFAKKPSSHLLLTHKWTGAAQVAVKGRLSTVDSAKSANT